MRKAVSRPVEVDYVKLLTGNVWLNQRKKWLGSYLASDGAVTNIRFDASVDPIEGDYVIKLSETDIYHVPAKVFEAKYVPV